MSAYSEMFRVMKRDRLSIRDAIIMVVEYKGVAKGDMPKSKERYMACYNEFNKLNNVDVYELTRNHNNKIDEWIIASGNYNKRRKESMKKCIRDYVIYEMEMPKELLYAMCKVYEGDVLECISEMDLAYNDRQCNQDELDGLFEEEW